MSAHFESSLEQNNSPETGKSVILVVDDSRVMRVALKKMLRADFEVIEAGDGEDGWNKLEQHPAITAVFSDLSMPVLDGFGLLERVRSSQTEWIREIPFIVITGNEEDDGVREKALASGATDFITKPFRSSEIMDRASRYVLQPQEQAPVVQMVEPAPAARAVEPVSHADDEADRGKVRLMEQQAAEENARRFAEQEAARMRESLLQRKKMEDEMAARRRAEEIARHEAVARQKAEEDLARRESMFEQRSHSLDNSAEPEEGGLRQVQPARAENNGNATIEFEMSGASLAKRGSQVVEPAANSRFESWHQNTRPDGGMQYDSERIKQDRNLQAELDEALNQALGEAESRAGMTQGLQKTARGESAERPELALDEMVAGDNQAIQRSEPALSRQKTPGYEQHAEIQAQPVSSSAIQQNNEHPPVSKNERLAETARIRETLNKMRDVEKIEQQSGYSYTAGLFGRIYLSILRQLHRISGSRFEATIKEVEDRLGK